MVDVAPGEFYLGGRIDPATKERDRESPVLYDSSHLTTHGVIVGMTGSGKTGLAVDMLEETLLAGKPTLIIDPKGDIGNLLLTFPNLAAQDFRPWINEGDAASKGVTPDEFAASTAAMWKDGLADWGIGPERIAALREKAHFTIYTPGSQSGVPLNLIGSLDAPAAGADPESTQDEIESFASSILGMIGVDADPLSSREHILITNLISNAWAQGQSMDLAKLIMSVQEPPMRKLGVLDLDSFFPAKDRTKLAMQLNGLVASPSFASWAEGPPLDIDKMLWRDGKPCASIVSLAHLSDAERQFVVTLVLSKAVTWMRQQSGTTDLRALIYFDEVYGFVPPTAAPPSKKPILTILKQARAFGLGMVLASQNPVDIDYKAISNAGTWMIGRLQTERDKARLLEGMSSAGGSVDVSAMDDMISGLGKREFVLQDAKESGPVVFGTRWAMSYLRGPLTRDQISTLMANAPERLEGAGLSAAPPPPPGAPGTAAPPPPPGAPAAAPAAPAAPPLADNESPVMPTVADGTEVAYIDAGAPWLNNLDNVVVGGPKLTAGLVARVNLLFDDTKADLRETQEYEFVWFPVEDSLDPDAGLAVDYDDRDLRPDAPANAIYVMPDAKIQNKTYYKSAQTALKDHLYRNLSLQLFRNAELKLYSRPHETMEDFSIRCDEAAQEAEDAEIEKLRDKLETKQDRLRDMISKAEDRVREIEDDADNRKQNELINIGTSVLGGLLGGRSRGRGLASAARRAASGRSQTSKAKQRLESAEHRLEEAMENLEDLEIELQDSIIEIDEKWEEIAGKIEPIDIALEKTDISVDEMVLCWFPTN
jgi:DNA-binding transcriptional regulator YiaG